MLIRKFFSARKIIVVIIFLLVAIQFIRIDTTSAKVAAATDFLNITRPSVEIAAAIKTSCYDCHSSEVVYPWYTKTAPVSWWIKHHVNEGCDELNFSEWGDYSSRRKDHKMKECIEQIQEGEMPMSSYTLMHGNATLSEAQKTVLVEFFKSLRTFESDKPKEEK
jgi:hypothetical protein